MNISIFDIFIILPKILILNIWYYFLKLHAITFDMKLMIYLDDLKFLTVLKLVNLITERFLENLASTYGPGPTGHYGPGPFII